MIWASGLPVTGASSGLGRATAILLARCGARLALIGRDRLDETLTALNPGAHAVHVADLAEATAA